MATLAVDAMGGDYAPQAVIEGVSEALDLLPGDFRMMLVGKRELIEKELSRVGKLGHPRLDFAKAADVVDMGDPSSAALRAKRDSSITVAVELMKQGKVQGVVSAGHTGAAVASTVVKMRTLPGIERPGIATVFPSREGHFVLLDAGSTIDCKPIHLVHYALMGDVYERNLLGKENPRIGLLSIGGEIGKGNDLTKETFKLLSQLDTINFIGNVEGHDLFNGNVDVVVCDGFVGNVVLKTCESLASALTGMLKDNLLKSPIRKLGAWLSRNAFRELRQSIDHAEYGGAPLLGVNGICVIAHGSSSPKAIRNAIRVANEFVEYQVNQHIVEKIKQLPNFRERKAAAEMEPSAV